MANSGPNTNGSQFFITTVATPHLNGANTIFGRILNAQEVADAISIVPKDQNARPTQPITMAPIQIAKTAGESDPIGQKQRRQPWHSSALPTNARTGFVT